MTGVVVPGVNPQRPVSDGLWLSRHEAGLAAVALEVLRRHGGANRDDLADDLAALQAKCMSSARGTSLSVPPPPATQAPAEFVTVQQAAGVLGCTPRAVRKAVQAGRLGAKRYGSQWLLDAQQVRRKAAQRARRTGRGGSRRAA